jgi:nitrogen regulatory protein PII
MTRIEIIANRSVQDDVTERLEAAIESFYYTVIPVVQGRGRQARRLGTSTWPEENFLLLAYVDDEAAEVARKVVSGVRERFPTEGIKYFELKGA